MACPHFLPEGSECALLADVAEDEEESTGPAVESPVRREWCLGAANEHLSCPIFRRFLSEFLP